MKEIVWSKEFIAKVLCINGTIEDIKLNEDGDISVSFTPSEKKKTKRIRLFESSEVLHKTDEIFKGSKK